MKNLVEKFTPEAVEATNEDGVVAIEYVVLAVAVIGVVGAHRDLRVTGARPPRLATGSRRAL